MADYPDFLNIPSPEMEEVRDILSPKQVERPYYASAPAQALSDYHAEAEQRANARDSIAMQAEIQRRMALPTVGGQRARQAAWQQAMQRAVYENQTKALLNDLTALDAADPEFGPQQDEIFGRHPIAREALRDPRVANLVKRQASENEEMQNIFGKDSEAQQEYANLRSAGRSPQEARKTVKDAAVRRAERIAFAAAGLDPAEIDSGKYNTPDGKLDKARLAYSMAQRKREAESGLSTTERKILDTAAESVIPPDLSPEGKARAFEKQFSRKPVTEDDWQKAFALAEAEGLQEREGLAALIEDLQKSGKRVPDHYRNMVGGTQPSTPQATAPAPDQTTNNQVPTTTASAPLEAAKMTREEVMRLPKGTPIKMPDGSVMLKK